MPLNLQPLSAVTPQPTSWLWLERIPRGFLTIIEGDPGTNKSTLLCDVTARITTGRPMPFSALAAPPASVWYFSTEDVAGRLHSMLAAHGADLTRVLCDEAAASNFRLPDALQEAEAAIAQNPPGLVVLDPLQDFFACRMGSDRDVRRALLPLVAMAERHAVAIVGVRHLTKGGATNPLYRGGGAVAIAAVSRSMLLVERDPRLPDRRVLAQIKSSFAPLAPMLGFRLAARAGAASIDWTGRVPYTLDDLMVRDHGRGSPRLNEATEVLFSILADGPVLAIDAYELAWQAARVSRRTLERAKDRLRVASVRDGFGRHAQYHWRLPENDALVQLLRNRELDVVVERLFSDQPASPQLPGPHHLLSGNRPRRHLSRD